MSNRKKAKIATRVILVIIFTLGVGLFLSYLYQHAIEAVETNTVVKNDATATTAASGQRKIVRAANGDLYAVYACSDGTNQQIYFAKSTDNGATWAAESKVHTDVAAEQKEPAIAIDSADNLYVAWAGKGWGANTTNFNIQYRKFNKATSLWQTQESVTDIANDQLSPSLAIDLSNNAHVAWYGAGWGTNTANSNIQYRKRAAAWQTQESVTDIANDQLSPSLAIDLSNNAHVAWYGIGWGTNAAINNIQYSKRVSGSADWSTNRESVTDSTSAQVSPILALDSSDNAHVAWYGIGWETNIANNNIQYSKRAAASSDWSANREAVSDKNNEQINPSIALDLSGNVYVAWTGKGWGTYTAYNNVQLRKRIASSWQAQQLITNLAVNQENPVLLWHLHPAIFTNLKTNVITNGFSFIWNNGSGIKFYASDGIIWPKVYFVLTPSSSAPVVGTSSTITITATKKDATNADVRVTDYSAAAAVSVRANGSTMFSAPSSGNPISLANVNFIAGVATVTLTGTTAQNVTVTATDQNNTSITGAGTISFQAAAENKLILNQPADIAAGTRAAYIVTLADAYNNNVNAQAGGQVVYLFNTSTSANKKFYDAASGGNTITSVTIPNGSSMVSFWYYDDTPGTYTITASDATPANGKTGLADAQDTITVNPASIAGYKEEELRKKHPGRELYELLVKVDDAIAKKAKKERPLEEKANYKEGDIVMIKPAGYLWGAEERTRFVIIKAYLSEKQARELMEPQTAVVGVDEKGRSISKIVKKRKYKLDITKEEFQGKRIKELKQLLSSKTLVDAGALVEKE